MKNHTYTSSDFEGSISIPIQLLTSEGRKQVGEAFDKFGSNSVTAAKGAWAATATPYTLAGAAYGLAGHAWSHSFGDGKSDFKVENGVLEFLNNPMNKPFHGAITLGHTINYAEDYAPNDTGTSYNGLFDIHVRTHEMEHVKQYDQLGIMFMPFYFAKGGISSNNKYEQNADNIARID